MVNPLSSVVTLLKVKGGNIKNYIGEDAEHRNSHSLLMKFIAKCSRPLQKIVWQFLTKLDIGMYIGMGNETIPYGTGMADT